MLNKPGALLLAAALAAAPVTFAFAASGTADNGGSGTANTATTSGAQGTANRTQNGSANGMQVHNPMMDKVVHHNRGVLTGMTPAGSSGGSAGAGGSGR